LNVAIFLLFPLDFFVIVMSSCSSSTGDSMHGGVNDGKAPTDMMDVDNQTQSADPVAKAMFALFSEEELKNPARSKLVSEDIQRLQGSPLFVSEVGDLRAWTEDDLTKNGVHPVNAHRLATKNLLKTNAPSAAAEFQCSGCDACFRTADSLLRHLPSHAGGNVAPSR